jgi:phospholipid transport system substrate-binding protein
VRLTRLLLFVLFLMPGSAYAEGTQSPTDVIEKLHAALLETMKNAEALGPRGRYDSLAPVLRQAYDFPRMASVAAGSHWNTMSEPEKSAVIDAFAHFSIANYASRFDGYSGEAFEIAGQRPGPRGSQLVDTRIIRGNGEVVPVTYVMTDRNTGWQIIDVLLDKSISELALRRSEYAKVLSDGGAARLAQILNEKAKGMLDGPA